MASVELFGETFSLVEDPADMEFAFLEFAEQASNADAESLAGAAAVMGLLRAALIEEDWDRFKACCRKNKARTERDLMPLVVQAASVREQAVEVETERPTRLPTGSSAGHAATAGNSPVGSSPPATPRQGDRYDQAIQALNTEGRPDLALFVVDAQRHHSTA